MEKKKVFTKPIMEFVYYEDNVFLAASNETVIDTEDLWDLPEPPTGGGA